MARTRRLRRRVSDQSSPFDDQRSSVPGTSLLLLQAPPYFAVEADRFRSWGQQESARLTESLDSKLELDHEAAGSGILHIQTTLRTFGGGKTWLEIKSVAIRAYRVHRPSPARYAFN